MLSDRVVVGLLLSLSLLAHTCNADAKAESTLDDMIRKIQSGEFDNNFFDGEVLLSSPQNDKEAVAGCLLDKVGAIVEERGVHTFVNDLQVDLAACCTKPNDKTCVEEVREAYKLLADVNNRKKKATDTIAAKVAGHLIAAARSRVAQAKVKDSHAHFLTKCNSLDDCTMTSLLNKGEL
eukprot:TRINITY_DN49204_c0_g1_i1.p1 TRINITY_DN49204_c0_g1~~TRINITY_DN49204_c0_g1_i1.p1  ORF type:complete len:179 (-),score=41.71 TRINITY_DN49204_c0_g1_i1:65-601(-)